MDHAALNKLIHLVIEGRISDDERATLEQQLRESAPARQQYLRALDTHATLQWSFRGKKPALAAGTFAGGNMWRWGAVAAAACLMLGVLIWINGVMNPVNGPVASASRDTPAARDAAVMAESRSVLWEDDSVAAEYSQLGAPLPPGPIALKWGVAQLMFEQGAVVHLRGPARLVVTGPNSAELVYGQLQAMVPPRASGFMVTGPGGTRVVDLGTEFVMQAERSGRVRVDVLKGRVKLSTIHNTTGRTLSAGFAAVTPGDGMITPMDVDLSLRSRFEASAQKLYEQRIASGDPLAYWPLTSSGICLGRALLPLDAGVLNIHEPGLHYTGGAASPTRGVEPVAGDATALKLNGPMSVETWIRLDQPPVAEQIMRLITMDGYRHADRSGWGLALLGRDGLRFTHYNVRDYDVSIDPLPIGQWVHVAVVVDAEKRVEFYIDGERRGFIENMTTPRYASSNTALTVGSLGDGTELYSQRITHLAVYDRALTSEEITEHYQIGKNR